MSTKRRMQVRVISLHTPSRVLKEVRRVFPDVEDVGVQRGVDVRKTSVDDLEAAGLITRTTRHALKYGRKWHHELSSKGAVGLAQAVRLALLEDVTQPLLLLEDDCTFRDPGRMRRDVESLLRHTKDFHMAAFGVMSSEYGEKVPYLSDGFHVLQDHFWLMHCALYSPEGRRLLGKHLSEEGLDMQIDSLFGSLARTGHIRILGQVRNHAAVQRLHSSAIQEAGFGRCTMCVFSPVRVVVPLSWVMGGLLLLYVWNRKGCIRPRA